MAIQSGENPKFLRERLLTFMNEKQREGGEAAEGADDGGKKNAGEKRNELQAASRRRDPE